MVMEYNPLKLGNRTISVRNWKVKDRDNFKNLLSKASNIKEQENALYQSLLFNVLEKPVALNKDELEYLFILLRVKNIGNTVEYTHFCPKCEKRSKVKLNIIDLIKYEVGELKDIEINDLKITLQEVQNVDYYNKLISKSENTLRDDLILHIKSINNDDTLGFDNIIKKFNDLDTEIMDKIFDEYEKMIFRISSREYDVKCVECGSSTTILFDEIPDLIPNKWTKR